jgi:hypothetical protein
MNQCLGGTYHLHHHGRKSAEHEISMLAGGIQSNQLAEVSDFIGNSRKMEETKTIPVGSPVVQNERPVSILQP